jgi:LysM repeat protein
MWKEEAIYQMASHGVPASITLAQGILESRDGNSRLAKDGNNHFGIKCHSDWEGKRIYEDDETRNECFRQYKNARESFDDHSLFLKKPRYASLFELNPDDYKGWAKGLRECGYATNPDYAKLLIRIIEENNLTQYDETGLSYAKSNTVPARNETTPEASVLSSNRTGRKSRTAVDKEVRSEITISNNHEVKVSDNNIKYVVVKEGETKESIAKDIDLNVWILNKFNDFSTDTQLKPGDIVYLQPKRNKANVADYTVQSGDTWFSISQKFGMKLKQLRKINAAAGTGDPTPGASLKLKKA